MSDKIKVLFLAANPTDTGPLRLGQEVREIDEKLEVGSARESFELIQHHALRVSDLAKVLLKHQPHIVHFSGHGSTTEEIVLEDNSGKSQPVRNQALAALFRILKDNVRIVVLNACFSKAQAEALKETIDYTIGTNKAVGDQAAITFAAAFYRALAFGRTVKEAFELAQVELELFSISGSDTPELFIRAGVDATVAFIKQKDA
ncbi:MAG TPA: CHAT domain-containing protein [Pyrinomonadaceae bacterium]|jgi:CHAT domain-containing protein|nr:CHAT domain-containing protein [Pyrinomonadaceae bacterium]